MKRTSRIKNAMSTGLLALASTIPSGCASVKNSLENCMPACSVTESVTNVTEGAQGLCDHTIGSVIESGRDFCDSKPKPSWDGYFSTTFATNYLKTGGFVIGKGPDEQGFLVLNRRNNLFEDDAVSFKAWQDYDLGNGQSSEIDCAVEYTGRVYFLKDLWKYDNPNWGDRITLGFQNWHFPEKSLGNFRNDRVLNFRWLHTSRLDVELGYTHAWEETGASKGDLFEVNVFREFPIGKFAGMDWYVNPLLGVSYDSNFFGENGFNFNGEILTGLKNKSWNLEGFAGAQKVTNSTNPLRCDVFYTGLRAGFRF